MCENQKECRFVQALEESCRREKELERQLYAAKDEIARLERLVRGEGESPCEERVDRCLDLCQTIGQDTPYETKRAIMNELYLSVKALRAEKKTVQ